MNFPVFRSIATQTPIQLGEKFYEAITAAPVPVDMRALKALKRSPLALDLYAWATYTAFQTQRTGQSRSLSWELLHEQIGGEYDDIKEFGRKARLSLRKVQAVQTSPRFCLPQCGLKPTVLDGRKSWNIRARPLTH